MGRRIFVALYFAVIATIGSTVAAQQRTYFVYVASEAADRITLVRFGRTGARSTTRSRPA